MDCSQVQEYLSDSDESGMANLTVIADHIDGCSNCRAELATYRELKGALRALSEHLVEPPSWLEGTITETVVQKAERQAALAKLQNRVVQPKVLTGGALLAAGLAGALLVRHRGRRHPTRVARLRQVLVHA